MPVQASCLFHKILFTPREKGYRSVEYLQLCICVQAQTANTFMRFSLRMYSRRLPFEREAIQMRKYTLGRKM